MKSTILSTGRITASDIITVTLIELSDSPATVLVRWPGQPSVTDPRKLQSVANSVMEVLAAAVAKLATIGDGERWP
jgi:hypothetical protein